MDIKKLRDEAKRALGRREIEHLIGYQKGSYGFRISPCFIDQKEDVDKLTFSPLCSLSLVNYLTIEGKPLLPAGEKRVKPKKVALFVRGCDSRALNQIIAEGGISPDQLYVIGIPCSGVIDLKKVEARFPHTADPVDVVEENGNYIITINDQSHTVPVDELKAETCKVCQYPTPLTYKKLVGEKREGSSANYDDIHSLEEMTPEERGDFWQRQFSRCIRCYACKNSCPLCYCDGCILEKLKIVSEAWA